MSKSTPLNQLQAPPPSFVNDQQKHIVTQAQAAIQTFQNPQDSNDDNNDQVQEVLQSISETFQMPAMPPPQMPMPNFQLPPMPQQFIDNYAPSNLYEIDTKISEDNNEMLLSKFLVFDNDVKLAAVCAAVFVIVTFIPLEKLIFKYISLDRVPYSGIIMKALAAAVVFYVFAKLLNAT